MKDERKHVVFENDFEISTYLEMYLEKNIPNKEIVFGLDHRSFEELAEKMTEAEVLLFQPTMLTFSQYNGLMMLMYDLMSKGTLSIKEIHIFHYRDSIEQELTDLWDGKRKFLDKVLTQVKVYQLDYSDNSKTEIHI